MHFLFTDLTDLQQLYSLSLLLYLQEAFLTDTKYWKVWKASKFLINPR